MKHAERLVQLWRRGMLVHDNLYFRGQIPKRKLAVVCSTYSVEEEEDVLVVYDDTWFGSARCGFVVTASFFGFKHTGSEPCRCSFFDLKPSDIQFDGESLLVGGARVVLTVSSSMAATINNQLGTLLLQTAHQLQNDGAMSPYREEQNESVRDEQGLLSAGAMLDVLKRMLPTDPSVRFASGMPPGELNAVAAHFGIHGPEKVLMVSGGAISRQRKGGFVVTDERVAFVGGTERVQSVPLRDLAPTDVVMMAGVLTIKGMRVGGSMRSSALASRLGAALHVILGGSGDRR